MRKEVMKPAVRVFDVGLMTLSANSDQGRSMASSNVYRERNDEKKKVSKRDGGAKREMRARAQVGRVLVCERRHKGKGAREMSAIGSVEAWREQQRRDAAKGIRRMLAGECRIA